VEVIRQKNWRSRDDGSHREAARNIANGLNISPLAARLLCLRGVTDVASANAFLNGRLAALPDPFSLKGMEAAVARLAAAIIGSEKILVHGDYDVDGISATALLVEFISAVGGQVGFHIPLRLKDGYGLSVDAFDRAAAQDVSLVVSVDCGVTAVEEAEVAKNYSIDLIITDHHQPPEVLPEAVAIVNPHLPDCPFPDKNLAGVGVAFFLVVGVRKELRERGHFSDARPEPDLRHMLDLVALGTIADVVPLVGVNRLLTTVGLQVLNGCDRPGVRALQQVAGVQEIDAGVVGFKLGPRLNAAGRIEDAAMGVKLLLSQDPGEASEIAALLDGFNRERQNIEARTLRQAEKAVALLDEERRSIVLADAAWHPGVIGIVASRLVERYYRPTFLLAIENGQAKGSGRSTREIHLYRALQACAAKLLGFGGHAAAAGLSVDVAAIDDFAEAFEQAVIAQQAERSHPCVEHDGEILLEELSVQAVRDLESIAPFGMGNPSPHFVVPGASVLGVKVVGDKHLKFSVRQDGYSIPCIAFSMVDRQEELAGEVDLLVVPELNRWNGRTEVQLRVRDFRRSGLCSG